MSKDNKPKFSLERRIALYLTICQDPTLDRTALHVAAVLLLKHTNSKSAKTVPGRDRIAEGMGRSECIGILRVELGRSVGRGVAGDHPNNEC